MVETHHRTRWREVQWLLVRSIMVVAWPGDRFHADRPRRKQLESMWALCVCEYCYGTCMTDAVDAPLQVSTAVRLARVHQCLRLRVVKSGVNSNQSQRLEQHTTPTLPLPKRSFKPPSIPPRGLATTWVYYRCVCKVTAVHVRHAFPCH